MTEGRLTDEDSRGPVTLGEVISGFAGPRRTGLLRFHGATPRIVAFHEGDIYLATSASGPSIHQIVVGSGAAPEAAWLDAAGDAAGIAQALDDDERVDSDRLRKVLLEHVVATLAELLAPGNDQYEFLADQTHQLGARFCFPADEVLADAGRRLTRWRSISTSLPSTGTQVRRSPTLPPNAESASLSAVEWQVLSAMPDTGSVAEVIDAAGLSAFTVFDVLHRLVRRGLVQAVAEDAGGR
jgi:hypothetical protein